MITHPIEGGLFRGLAELEPDVINLALAGSAMLDPFTARAMRDTPADVISVKIGINLVNADVMRLRAFEPAVHGFLDTIRDGHPEVPLLVVGPLYCPIHEHTPGPAAFDPSALVAGQLRFRATGDPAETSRGTFASPAAHSPHRDRSSRIRRERRLVAVPLVDLGNKPVLAPWQTRTRSTLGHAEERQ